MNPDMKVFIRVLLLTKRHPITLFVEAFDYYEVRISRDEINEVFTAHCKKTGNNLTLMSIPKGVFLYCVDVFMGVCKPLDKDSLPPDVEEYKGRKLLPP